MNISAPGKLVLAGEYAVLEGYTGLAMAVNRRVTLTFCKPVHHSALWEAIAQGCQQARFKINSNALREKGHKLGLGSSAASAVCMAAYINPERAYELAFEGHQRFSKGFGSGIDIAASYYGGLIRFQAGQVDTLSPGGRGQGEGCDLLTVFMGASQNTRSFLSAVLDFRSKKPEEYAVLMKELGALTPTWELFYTHGLDSTSLGQLVKTNLELLKKLGKEAQIEIIDAKQIVLQELVKAYGGYTKPSGAGGGDIALCFIPLEQREACQEALSRANFSPLDLDYFAPGLLVENSDGKPNGYYS